MLLGLLPLGVVLAVAIAFTLARSIPRQDPAVRDPLVRLYLLGLALQCLHVIEEFTTDFYLEFPRFLGLAPWTPDFFVAFNLVWIAIWVLSAIGFREGIRLAMAPIWFFALGMAVNGVAHPALALAAGGYFPGLWTSPLVGVLGVVLSTRLFAATQGGVPP